MDDKKKPTPPPASTESEIRRERRFTVAEAVGREAAGALKGASPVARARQMVLELAELLETALGDPEGSLRRTLLVRLEGDPPLLARHFAAPEAALAELLDAVLASPTRLAELVRQTDARWGRDYGERPRFQADGAPPAADDPYTVDGVRAALTELRAHLRP